jgi:hypothetical protein
MSAPVQWQSPKVLGDHPDCTSFCRLKECPLSFVAPGQPEDGVIRHHRIDYTGADQSSAPVYSAFAPER